MGLLLKRFKPLRKEGKMDKYVIKNKNNSKLFYMDREIGGGGYCDWADTDEQLQSALKDPNNIVYFDSFEDAWDHLRCNGNEIEFYLLDGSNEVFENISYISGFEDKIQYFGSIEKLAQSEFTAQADKNREKENDYTTRK